MRAQAVLNAAKALGLLSADGELITAINQAYLHNGVKPRLD